MDSQPLFICAEEIWALRGRPVAGARFSGLYVRGTIEALACPTVAIVGSRAASADGRRIAWRFAADLGRAGVCVISGLALGIDGAAHAGALSVGAATVGVLGGGHNRFFPARNRELAAAMLAKGGAVISPFAPEEPAYPSRFLERNGIIAVLADAVVVIEAAARSGSLNTATWAANANIPVLAVPGDIDRPKVAGCHALIRDGAMLARHAGDVLEAIGIAPVGSTSAQELPLPFPFPFPFPPQSLAVQLAQTLARQPMHVEELAAQHAVTVPELLSALAHLLLAGTVSMREDGAYTVVPEV